MISSDKYEIMSMFIFVYVSKINVPRIEFQVRTKNGDSPPYVMDNVFDIDDYYL